MERVALADGPVELRRRRARHPAQGDHALAQLLRLQRTAGNRAVTRLLQRRPIRMPPNLMSTTLVGPVAGPFEGAVSSDPYERQPEALRRVLDASGSDGALWWMGLDRQQRFAVASIYNRFQRLGIWGYAKRIRKVVHGTPPWCGFWVQGDTPSVEFEGDAEGLMSALLASTKFCMDAGIGATLHAGQHSHREISDSDSLHVSVGTPESGRKGQGQFSTAGRNLFDAHIDRYASPKGKKGFACEYDPTRTAAHEGREVIPGLAGKVRGGWPRVGGFQVFPEDPSRSTVRPEMFDRGDERDKAPPSIIGITGHF